jgi:F0F1-type ATP synthase assembly protein I
LTLAFRRPRAPVTAWGRAFEVSFEAGLAVILGVVIGHYLDGKLGTEPIFLFVFLALGFGTGVRRLLAIRWPAAGETTKPHKKADRESDS